MTTQGYLIIENNVVTNVVMWDGNLSTWTPPTGSIQVVQDTIPVLLWFAVYEEDPVTKKQVFVEWTLTQQPGIADVGYTWNGTQCVTNQPMPPDPTAQPVVEQKVQP
jgi:hypothetical protein